MRAQLRRAIWVLGACQCVFWGVLYYGFSVQLVPLQLAFDASRTMVAGAFSLGLLVTALTAPLVGRGLDRDRGQAMMRAGVWLAVAGLIGVSLATSLWGIYIAWAIIGMSMAALLYEPAFGLVIRSVSDESNRLKALSAVTVLGGLASTLCLPLLALSFETFGLRGALWLGALAVIVAGASLERWVFPDLAPQRASNEAQPKPLPVRGNAPHLFSLSAVFVSGTLASMSLTVMLIPLLLERGVTATASATALAALGLTQLPGRLWLLRGHGRLPLPMLTTVPVVLQATGLAVVVADPSLWATLIGVAVFGLGAGLQTLARPWLVQRACGMAAAGYWNGRVARSQGLARAAGPIAAASLSQVMSCAAVFWALSALMCLMIPIARALGRATALDEPIDSIRPASDGRLSAVQTESNPSC